MPREGYRSITVRDEVYRKLEEKAKETHRTIPEIIMHLAELDCKQEV